MNTPKKKVYTYPKTWELTKPHGIYKINHNINKYRH